MKWGMIVRADDRGLSHLTWEMARALQPDRVLLVDMCDERFATRHTRYDGIVPEITEWVHGALDQRPRLAHFFDGLDVCYSAETWYGLLPFAQECGVRTVTHVMPEFFRDDLRLSDELWLPTPWLNERVGVARYMPVPVPLDRWPVPEPPRGPDETLRVYLPAGKMAMGDRNGARVFMQALRHVTEPMEVTVNTQERAFPVETRMSRTVRYRLIRNAVEYWTPYARQHVCVIPRRYGGLCLPALEACGAGLGLIMTDCSPNHEWPCEVISASPGAVLQFAPGDVQTYDADPRDLARILDEWAASPERTRERQYEARRFAETNSWANWKDRYLQTIASVAVRS